MHNFNYFQDWEEQSNEENNNTTNSANETPSMENQTPNNTIEASTNNQITENMNTFSNGTSIIKVIGVGGGGGNAINHMYKDGIEGVEFVICNTDAKDLAKSPVTHKVQLGAKLTEGRGAGAKPEVGKNAAIENIDEIKSLLSDNTKMVFVTAGMGGGTGTGAAPIIAGIAKEMNILTVGIVTIPFSAEGKIKRKHAEEGIAEMRKNVDTLIIICNDKLREIHGSLPFTQAFSKADDVLATAARSIAEIISTTGIITQDFNDVRTVMENGGTAIMGIAIAGGENRAMQVVENALSSPLLNDNNIKGASQVLLSVTTGSNEATMDEIGEIQDFIQTEAGDNANIILGLNKDESLGDAIKLIIIATGFETSKHLGFEAPKVEEKKINVLTTDSKVYTTPIVAEQPTVTEEPKAPVASTYGVADVDGFILKKVETVTSSLSEQPVAEQKVEEVPTIVHNLFEETVEPTATVENTESTTEYYAASTIDSYSYDVNENYSVEETTMSMENSTEEITASVTQTVDEIPFEIVTETEETVVATTETTWEEQTISYETKVEETIVSDTTKKVYDLEGNQIAEQPAKTPAFEKKVDERISKLKEFNSFLKSRAGLSELENEPAFKRKGIVLNDVTPSNESQVSKFTLSEGENNKTELRSNNSFLHDNVD